MRNEKHGGRAEADGLRLRFWRGDHGDGDLWFCRRIPCVEEDVGESAASGGIARGTFSGRRRTVARLSVAQAGERAFELVLAGGGEHRVA